MVPEMWAPVAWGGEGFGPRARFCPLHVSKLLPPLNLVMCCNAAHQQEYGAGGDQDPGKGGTVTSIYHPLLTAPCCLPLLSLCPRWTLLGLGDSPLPPASVEREAGRL